MTRGCVALLRSVRKQFAVTALAGDVVAAATSLWGAQPVKLFA